MPGQTQPIYEYNKRTKTYERVKRPQIVKTIKAAYKITSREQYKKFFDITRNKLRAYQSVHAGEYESTQKFLYTTAKSMLRYGSEYQPSERTKAIFATPSISSGEASLSKYKQTFTTRKMVLDRVKADFQEFINTLPQGYKSQLSRIYNQVLNDPKVDVKSYQNALDALAKKYKAVRKEGGEVVAGGSVSGSGVTYEKHSTTFHFGDYVSYLE